MKRLIWILRTTFFFAAIFLTVFAEAEEGSTEAAFAPSAQTTGTGQPTPAAAAAVNSGVPSGDSVCLGDSLAVEDLRHRREELEARKAALDARDNDLQAREKALGEQLAKIQQVRNDVTKIDGARKKEGDEKVTKLVDAVSSMSPKTASALLVDLDETLAVATMSRIETPRLAKILNVMDSAKAARLTELLAGVVRARNIASADKGTHVASASHDAAETAKTSTKGGEKNDGQNQ